MRRRAKRADEVWRTKLWRDVVATWKQVKPALVAKTHELTRVEHAVHHVVAAATDVRQAVERRQLEVFLAIADAGSFTRAAARLHVAQPSLSYSVRQLEKELGVSAAAAIFSRFGFKKASIDEIAKEAGVAVGNAYYYFDSKEHLIQGFYDRNQAAHRAAAEVVLANEKDFATRLRGVLHAGIDVNQPYHSFAATFFKTAAEPRSEGFRQNEAALRAEERGRGKHCLEDPRVARADPAPA